MLGNVATYSIMPPVPSAFTEWMYVFRILQGLVAIVYGFALVKSKLLSGWVGGAGVVIGAITLYEQNISKEMVL